MKNNPFDKILQTKKRPSNHRNMLIKLKIYVNKFAKSKIDDKEERLIVMYGLRGIGKTTLLLQTYDYLINELKVPRKNVLFLSVDDLVNSTASNLREAITTYVRAIHNKSSIVGLDEKVYLLIDEAHFDKNWQITAKTVYDQSNKVFVLITGSSVMGLQIGGDTGRRAIEEPLSPLTFSEYELLKNNISQEYKISETLSSLVTRKEKTSALLELSNLNFAFKKKIEGTKKDFDREIHAYMHEGGFTVTLNTTDNFQILKNIQDVVDQIIKKDMITELFRESTKTYFKLLIDQLALKIPGETSYDKLSKDIGISKRTTIKMFEALEKTGLIFSIRPFVKSAGKYGRAPLKYYYILPSILYALRSNLDLSDKANIKGIMLETAVGSSLLEITKKTSTVLFYDKNPNKNVDFLLMDYLGKITPIECGFNKDYNQINDAIKRYKADVGFLVTNIDSINLKGKIIEIPFHLFLS